MNILWTDKKRTLFGLPFSFTTYELEEERLFIRTGFFTRKEDEVRLYRIMDISWKQTLRQRIFGVGTIHCCSSDATMKEFDIINIKKTREVKEMLSQKVEEQRDEKRVYYREALDLADDDDMEDEE